MSGNTVEIVRAALEAWGRSDWDAAFQNAAPDLEVDNTRNLGEFRGVQTTPDRVRREWESFAEIWESVRIEVDEVAGVGDHVVSRQTVTLRGRDGIEVTARMSYLWRLHEGTITHLVSYREWDDALEAAGRQE